MSEWTHKDGVDGIKKQAQELIEQAYQRGYKAGKENEYQRGFQDGKEQAEFPIEYSLSLVEQGKNEAWKAAHKLVSMGCKECHEVLGYDIAFDGEIFVKCTASEAIEKLRTYEEQKKQEEDSEIHIGDEVTDGNDIKGVVVGLFRNLDGTEFISILGVGEDFEVPQIMPKKDYKKTGRHFHEIAEVLKKMQEGK